MLRVSDTSSDNLYSLLDNTGILLLVTSEPHKRAADLSASDASLVFEALEPLVGRAILATDGLGDLGGRREVVIADRLEELAILELLAEVVEHPDTTEELADVLSTSKVEVEYEVKSGVSVKD